MFARFIVCSWILALLQACGVVGAPIAYVDAYKSSEVSQKPVRVKKKGRRPQSDETETSEAEEEDSE